MAQFNPPCSYLRLPGGAAAVCKLLPEGVSHMLLIINEVYHLPMRNKISVTGNHYMQVSVFDVH